MKFVKFLFGLCITLGLVSILTTTNAKAGSPRWVLTEEESFAYDDGKSKYVSKQNEYYKYICNISKSGNSIDLIAIGGFYHPTDSSKNTTGEFHHLCSIPNDSYAAGELVILDLESYKLVNNKDFHGGSSIIQMRFENKEADGKTEHKWFDGINKINFDDEDVPSWSSFWLGDEEKATVKAKMPETAEIGDKIAIIYQDLTSYDSWGDEPQQDFGGTIWYAWIYTYMEEPTDDIITLDDEVEVDKVSGLKVTNKKGNYIYVSFKKVSDADGYEIRYADNKSMKNATIFASKVLKGYFKNSKGKIKFTKGKTYYVQVRAYIIDEDDEKIYGDWSAKKKVKIKK